MEASEWEQKRAGMAGIKEQWPTKPKQQNPGATCARGQRNQNNLIEEFKTLVMTGAFSP